MKKRILLFGGTTEGRILAQKLQKDYDLTVSVTTEIGVEELDGIHCHILCGPMLPERMEEIVDEYDLVIDATHPYASQVSKHIREVCEKKKKQLERVERARSTVNDAIFVGSCLEAAEVLQNTQGNVLIATGAKNLQEYAILDKERLFPRVLPTHMGIEACEKLGVPHKNILAMQGPFTEKMNIAMMEMHDIKYLVTKDGGDAGGFQEKQEAAKKAGAILILVGRPDDCGIEMEELLMKL